MRLLHSLDVRKSSGDVILDNVNSWSAYVYHNMTIQGFSAKRHSDVKQTATSLNSHGLRCKDKHQLKRFMTAYHLMFIPKLHINSDSNGGVAFVETASEEDAMVKEVHDKTMQHLCAQRALWGWLGYLESAHHRLEEILIEQRIVELQTYIDRFCREMELEHRFRSSTDKTRFSTQCPDEERSGESMGYNIWSLNSDYENCLHRCVRDDFLQGTRILAGFSSPWVNGSSNCNQRDRFGDTPLHVAARWFGCSGRSEHLKYLLEAPGVDVRLTDKSGETALHLLLRQVQTRWAKQRQLLGHKALLNDACNQLDPSPAHVQKLLRRMLERAKQMGSSAGHMLTMLDNTDISVLEQALATGVSTLVVGLLQEHIVALQPTDESTVELLRRLLQQSVLMNRYDTTFLLANIFLASKPPANSSLASLLVTAVAQHRGQALRALLAAPTTASGQSFKAALNIACSHTGLVPLQAVVLKAFMSPVLPPQNRCTLSRRIQSQIRSTELHDDAALHELLATCRLLLREGADPAVHLSQQPGGGTFDNLFALAAAAQAPDVLRVLLLATNRSDVCSGILHKPEFYLAGKSYVSNPLCACITTLSGSSATDALIVSSVEETDPSLKCLTYLLTHSPFISLVDQADGACYGQHHLSPLALAIGRGHIGACKLLLAHGADATKTVPSCLRLNVSKSAETNKYQLETSRDVVRSHMKIVAVQYQRQGGRYGRSQEALQQCVVTLRDHADHSSRMLEGLVRRLRSVTREERQALLEAAAGDRVDKDVAGPAAKMAAGIRQLILVVLGVLKTCRVVSISVNTANATHDTRKRSDKPMREPTAGFTSRDWGKILFRKPSMFAFMAQLAAELAALARQQSVHSGTLPAQAVRFSLAAAAERAATAASALGQTGSKLGTGSCGAQGWRQRVNRRYAQNAVELMLDFCAAVTQCCLVLQVADKSCSGTAFAAKTDVAPYLQLAVEMRAHNAHLNDFLYGGTARSCISFIGTQLMVCAQCGHCASEKNKFNACARCRWHTGPVSSPSPQQVAVLLAVLDRAVQSGPFRNGVPPVPAVTDSSFYEPSRDVISYGGM